MFITFDTNFYRKLVEGIDANDNCRLKEIAKSLLNAEKDNDIVSLMNITTAEELLHHLLDDSESREYKSCLKAVKIMGMHCFDNVANLPRVLPSPFTQVSHSFFGEEYGFIDSKIANVVCDISNDVNNIDKHIDCLQKIKRHIEDSEQGLIQAINELCKNIDPNYTNWHLFYNDPANRKKYLESIRSDSFANITAHGLFAAVKQVTKNEMVITECYLNNFKESYKVGIELRRYFFEQLLNPNFDLTKKSRANFFWDEQILYSVGNTINGSQIKLVTSDKKMIEAAAKKGLQDCVMTFDDYIAFLKIKL